MDEKKETARPRGTDSEFVEDLIKEIRQAYTDARGWFGDPAYLSKAEITFVSPNYESKCRDCCISSGCISFDGRRRVSRDVGGGRITVFASDMPYTLELANDDDVLCVGVDAIP